MVDASDEAFYSGALERIGRFMVIIATAAIALGWFRYGWRVALGLALGCTVAYLNFFWLKVVVSGLADAIEQTGTRKSGKGMVVRFVLRYLLMSAGGYVILTVSPASLYGFLSGVFLPVVAIACEAAFETYVALARGI